jgi:hypothetical protein
MASPESTHESGCVSPIACSFAASRSARRPGRGWSQSRPAEPGPIRAGSQFYPNRMIGRGAHITLRQPLAQITGGNPYYGIVTRIVIRRSAKYLHRDGGFFELGFLAAEQCLPDGICQEIAATLAAGKLGRAQEALHLGVDDSLLIAGKRLLLIDYRPHTWPGPDGVYHYRIHPWFLLLGSPSETRQSWSGLATGCCVRSRTAPLLSRLRNGPLGTVTHGEALAGGASRARYLGHNENPVDDHALSRRDRVNRPVETITSSLEGIVKDQSGGSVRGATAPVMARFDLTRTKLATARSL